jgi:branched-chain amino acid transport system substrate-binding protein
MRFGRIVAVALAAVVGVGLGTAGAGSGAGAAKPTGTPIVIGAVVDLTKAMAPFDAPALQAAQIEIAKINAAGGVAGHPLQIKFINSQLDPQRTKQDAASFVGKVQIGWVTCDVDYATPAVQEFLKAKLLTVAPCIGTDQMGPSRFGSAGKLAFSFGNAAQDEGSAMAEYAISRGWKSAVVVTDNLLVYFKNVCQGFSARFEQLGGKVVKQEGFTQGDKTINNVVSRVNGEKPQVIAFCTSFAGDQPAFVAGLRTLGNKTPIINGWASDGAYWWTKSPKVTNFYFLTYAGAVARDPDASVRAFEAKLKSAGHAAQTGGFITGADAVDAIAYAIRKAGGSTDGAKLAAILEKLTKFQTLGGPISFKPDLHSVTGRPYRVILIDGNKAKVLTKHSAKVIADIH